MAEAVKPKSKRKVKAKKTKESPSVFSKECEEDDHDNHPTKQLTETKTDETVNTPGTSSCQDDKILSTDDPKFPEWSEEKKGNITNAGPQEKEDYKISTNVPCAEVEGSENVLKYDMVEKNDTIQTTSITPTQTDSFHSCAGTLSPSSLVIDYALTEKGENNDSNELMKENALSSVVTQIKELDLSLEEVSNHEISWPPDSLENQTEVKNGLLGETECKLEEKLDESFLNATDTEMSETGATLAPTAEATFEVDKDSREMMVTAHDNNWGTSETPPEQSRQTSDGTRVTSPEQSEMIYDVTSVTPPEQGQQTSDVTSVTPPKQGLLTSEVPSVTPPEQSEQTSDVTRVTSYRQSEMTSDVTRVTPPEQSEQMSEVTRVTPPEQGQLTSEVPSEIPPAQGQLTSDVTSMCLDEYAAERVVNEPNPIVVHRRLYPKLDQINCETSLKSFTEEQLRTLYYNHELEHSEEFVGSFLQEITHDKHEFYEILMNYYRARNNLSNAEHDIQILRKDQNRYIGLAWETKEEKITVQGHCSDKAKVSGEVVYHQAVFNENAAQDADRTFKNIRNHIHNELSLFAYEAQLSRLQVESYIHQLYLKNPALMNLPPNAPVQAWLAHQREGGISHQVEALRTCISILFMFQRKPAKDDVFVKDTRLWLQRLVASLLRVSTLEDHLFIINQVLRCPMGISSWAVGFVQVLYPASSPGQSTWGSPLLDHFLTMMATILLPIRSREELLYQLKVTLTPASDKGTDNPWILVDSDGEEDEDPQNSWHFLQENDIVCLLNQLPMDLVYRHVLFISHDNDHDSYDIHLTSEAALLKTCAFATRLIRLLDNGLRNFSLGRYRQLNKRLGRMIRDLVHYLNDHWENYQIGFPSLSADVKSRLQVEYDHVLQRAISAILMARKLGSWQFLTDLPYNGISMTMLWRLLIVMHQGCQKTGDMSDVDKDLTIEECQARLNDADNKLWFEEQLMTLPTAEATFLLTTFANMARSRSHKERAFIEIITTEIYEIAYIRRHTREFCSKPGRELLASITAQHPGVISMLLKVTKDTMNSIGMVSLYLYKELPLYLWVPTETDWSILREWLLNNKPSTPQCQLAMLVIDHLNWGLNQQANALFLDLSTHRQMAVLLVEVYTVYLTGKSIADLFTEGIELPAGSKGYQTEEYQLASWAWELALRLHLHSSLQPRPALSTPSESPIFPDVPDLNAVAALRPIQQAVKDHFSIAYYLTLVMTKLGHETDAFCSEGLHLLAGLTEKSHFIPLIKALACITPMFFKNTGHSKQFSPILQSILNVDATRKSYFSSEFPGPVTAYFSGMIQTQIQSACIPGESSPLTVIEFWLVFLTDIPNWSKDKSTCYVLDGIIAAAFRIQGGETKILQYLNILHEQHLKAEKDHGVLGSLVSWLSPTQGRPSLLDPSVSPAMPWLAFCVLHLETLWEESSGLWLYIQRELFSNQSQPLTVETALKKAVTSLKLEPPPLLDQLSIYRWAYLAIDLDISHPLLPLIWQRFFILYLGRMATEPGLPQRGSVGEKFFLNPSYNSLSKKMKKRLGETADHYHQMAVTARRHNRSRTPGIDLEESIDETVPSQSLFDPDNQAGQQDFYESLVRFYQTLAFWLDEPRLHDPNLYLPALPPQYEPGRLVALFQYKTDVTATSQSAWREFIDFSLIDSMLTEMVKKWTGLNSQDSHQDSWSHVQQNEGQQKNATERLLLRLSQRAQPLPPPDLKPVRAPVPDLNPNLLCDQQNLLFALRSDFNTLVDFAKLYCMRVSKNVALDEIFMELLPSWYINETTEGVITIPCRSMINPAHSCKGPAVITCRYEAMQRDDIINRKIDENRAEYKQLMIESLLPPAQNICSAAVHVENAITSLIKLCQSHQSSATRKLGKEVGTALFYHMATYISEDTKFYPPTCQFFASCIEILGQEFILGNPGQSQPLLQAILQTPSLTGHLSPNFSPNATPELFVNMYEDMIRVPSNQGPDVAFTLLSKFDIQSWLDSSKPALSQRSTLVAVIGKALCSCGQDPDPTLSSVFQMYRIHLLQLLRYKFPDHYGEIMKLVIKGCSNEQLSPSVLDHFLTCLEQGSQVDLKEGEGENGPALSVQELSLSNLKESVEWLSNYFFRARVTIEDNARFGLYPKWKIYVEGLAGFFKFLCTHTINSSVIMASNGQVNPETAVGELWKLMVDLYAPWIQPLDNHGDILTPWIQSDETVAAQIMAVWIGSISHLQNSFEALLPLFSHQALTLLWPYYVTTIAKKSTPQQVLGLFHSQLVTLPWEKYYPDIQAVELMMQIYDGSYHSCCFEFLGNMFTMVQWPALVHHYTTHDIPEIVTRLHVCLFKLLVQLSREKPIVENTSLPQLMVTAESFNWNYLDASNYDSVIGWFLQQCDPKCVLSERTTSVAKVLNLLKSGGGFSSYHDPQSRPDTPKKRCAYVRCIAQLVCKCSHLPDVEVATFAVVVTNLLTEIETLVGTIPDPAEQRLQAITMSMEVLCILNNCNPLGPTGSSVLNTLQDWVGSSPTSVLLIPLLTAACRGLASLSYMVRVVEKCIEAHFTADVNQQDMSGWGLPLIALEVPDLNRELFIKEATVHSCYLTLFAHILQQFPLCQSLNDEMQLLEAMVEWTAQAKPSADSETKMFLIWTKVCELTLRQVDFGASLPPLVSLLHKFISAVALLGEDKATGGLLGAIGLGKRSQLTPKFRFIAKAISMYLAAQVPRDNKLRVQPNAPGYLTPKRPSSPIYKTGNDVMPSQQAIQAYSHLESLRANKQYSAIREHLEYTLNYVTKPENTIRETWGLLTQLIGNIFSDVSFLNILYMPVGK